MAASVSGANGASAVMRDVSPRLVDYGRNKPIASPLDGFDVERPRGIVVKSQAVLPHAIAKALVEFDEASRRPISDSSVRPGSRIVAGKVGQRSLSYG